MHEAVEGDVVEAFPVLLTHLVQNLHQYSVTVLLGVFFAVILAKELFSVLNYVEVEVQGLKNR